MKAKYTTLCAIVLLCGCESMPRGELAYQTLHAVDVLQTINGPATDDCYKEANPITRRIVGEKPSKGQVVAWGVGQGLLHYGISSYLEDNSPGWIYGAWQILSTGTVAITIHDNYELGVKPWGDNDHSKITDAPFTCGPPPVAQESSPFPDPMYAE